MWIEIVAPVWYEKMTSHCGSANTMIKYYDSRRRDFFFAIWQSCVMNALTDIIDKILVAL